jgi:hypothetical protein
MLLSDAYLRIPAQAKDAHMQIGKKGSCLRSITLGSI